MIHTLFIANIPVYIDTHHASINTYFARKIDRMVTTLKELADDIVKIDIQLEETIDKRVSPRRVAVTLYLPGLELKASDSGAQWKLLIKHVQARLKLQVEKRKELLKRRSITGVAA